VGVGFEGEAGPSASGDLGDGEEGAPVVGDAVVSGRGHGRVADLQGGKVVLGPAGELAAEDGFNFGVAAVEMGGEFSGFGGQEQDANGTGMQGFRQGADAGENGWAEGFEGADGIAFATVGAGAQFVSGIEKAAQFFGARQVGIDFVQEQGGLMVVHEAKEDGGGDILGAQGPRGHGGEEIEDGGLATLRLGGSEVQARRVEERGNCVGVGVPEGDGHGRAGRQNGIVGEAGGDLGQDFRTIHRLWPGFNGWQFDGAGLRFVVNIGSAPGNLGIEGFKAYAQARRFGLARAVVLGGGEGGEGVESL